MEAEMHGGDAVVNGGVGFDPSNLHLRKELTQIKKVARVLKDPGTTSSSWRSPIRSPMQVTNSSKQHYYHHHHHSHQFKSNNDNNHSGTDYDVDTIHVNEKIKEKQKEKKVYLYNWRMQRSDSEKSRQRNNVEIEGSSSTPEESVGDSLSDAQINGIDSKSDTYINNKYGSMILNCKDTHFVPSIRPSIRRRVKKTPKRLSNVRSDLVLSPLEDADDYYNSDGLRKGSVSSPLLARLKSTNWRRLSAKIRDSRKENLSYTNSTPALSTNSFRKYKFSNGSIVGSWEGTTSSLNDGDDDQLNLTQKCGIPCYWSRKSTPKSRGSFYSPSLSDTVRRKWRTNSCGPRKKTRRPRKSGQGLVPLLTDARGGSSIGSDDDFSTNEELDLEALNKLDGKRWSTSEREVEENSFTRLSHKYRPLFFEELIGQNIVVQSLTKAISKNRIAPVYLFQGPRGTGKTSTAKIFADALNCLAKEEPKPCGVCKKCADFVSGKSKDVKEVDGASKNGINNIKYYLENLLVSPRYQIFIVNECHLLSSKTWLEFLKFLEDPQPRVVFILVTTDLDNLPRTVLSRTQKYMFNKIRDIDILNKLKMIASEENLDVEMDALDLIAMNTDGSLRDAETMLEQLSLLRKRISVPLVNELIGVVSDEKLLELLELALSSDTAETVKRARELVESGADPIVIMSQLASLIMDIIAGTRLKVDGLFFNEGNLTDMDIERLKHALKLLSEAEKQLRGSNDRSTWFIATLLQLGTDPTYSGSSRRHSSRMTEQDNLSITHRKSISKDSILKPSQHDSFSASRDDEKSVTSNSRLLGNIWTRCLENCHSKTLRQFLLTYGKLVSISQVEGIFVAYIAFSDNDVKTRAERFVSSITNSFEFVLRSNVEVRIVLLPDEGSFVNSANPMEISDRDSRYSPLIISRKSLSNPEVVCESGSKRVESIIREQRLETAWLKAMDKGTPRILNRVKLEKNQILPHHNQTESLDFSSQNYEDQLSHEIKEMKIGENQTSRRDLYPLSPSLLHHSSFVSKKESTGYESSSGPGGCGGLFCWNSDKPKKRVKVKQGTPVKRRRFSLFGECAKTRSGNKYKR